MKTCPSCGIEKDLTDFYIRKGTLTHSYCKKCVNIQTLQRQRKLKSDAIQYKGGVCYDCGIKDHPAIYDFHHTDPSVKDFTIGNVKQYKLESIKNELDKCILLCSNCHRKRHAKY